MSGKLFGYARVSVASNADANNLSTQCDTTGGRTAAKCFRRSLLAQRAYQVDLASVRIKLGPDWTRSEEGAGLASQARVMACSPARR